SAMNAAINTQDMMMVGITLIHPASLGHKAPPNQITSSDITEFSIKCDVYARLCNMFVAVTSREDFDEAAHKTWLDIFQQRLVYPLPTGHPLLGQNPPAPDIPPPSSPA